MSNKVLVTGGAGFIGSYLTDRLVEQGHDVRIFDNLTHQVHQGKLPGYLNKRAEFIKRDVSDYSSLKKAIEGIEFIFHFAARVGIGQSMYQVKDFVEANTIGTANLMDILANTNHNIKKLIVAGSFTIYGEGSYKCQNCGIVEPKLRSEEQLKNKEWEMNCPKCGKTAVPVPITEEKSPNPTSIYAITKKDQEDICMSIGKSYGIPTVVLRYPLVYGPRQSLNNPYTGVITIFINRLMNNKSPVLYEDGLQTRDFVYVHDVVSANILAMKSPAFNYQTFNIGTGKATSIKQVAELLAKMMKKNIKPEITHQYRKGDVRHCIADFTKVKKLGFEPKFNISKGLQEVIEWSSAQTAEDRFDEAAKALKDRNLTG